MDESEHHVKFLEKEDSFPKSNCVTVKIMNLSSLQVHLGFLKLNHNYSVTIPLNIPEHTPKDVKWISKDGFKSFYTTFKSYEIEENKGILVVEFKAGKPKLMTDLLKLYSPTDFSTQLELALICRVLGKGQGTPSIRDGIHCIGVDEVDEESETSDWQGFD